MTHDTLLALALFAFATSVTPGPNNLMLLASGANFGFRRTIPHMLGIATGFVVLLVLVGLGLMALFEHLPWLQTGLKVVCLAYLMWLALKIATAAAPGTASTGARPMTFLQAAAFQWVNPKAWAMATTAVSVYAPERGAWNVVIVGLVFGAINLPTVSSWTLIGQRLGRVIGAGRRLRIFNLTMAGLLLLSSVPML